VVIQLKTKTPEERAAVPREVLFELDGVPYEVDKEFNASFALAYVNEVAQRGVDAGHIWLLQHALGEGYIALRAFPDLEAADLAGIVNNLLEKINAAMDPGKKLPSGL